jgi:(S)-citramalyl-CoA lyase
LILVSSINPWNDKAFLLDLKVVRTNYSNCVAKDIPMNPALGLQSMLFVPGSKPDRFAKALASEADLVCIDLEDSVPADGKADARAAAIAAIGDPRLAIRINGLKTADGLRDLLALAGAQNRLALIFVPMVESATEIEIVRSVMGDVGIIPLIETVRGLRAAHDIAATDGVVMMMLGGGDFSAELGVELAWEPLLAARSSFVMACAGAGIPGMDVPFIRMDDAKGLEDECTQAKELGFAAKAAIHPSQIEAIHNVFRPSAAEVEEAMGAKAAFAAANGAAVRFNGRMLEAPIMRRYQAILALKDRIDA